MPTAWETYPIKFEGGLITSQGRLEQGSVSPGSATTLQNFEADVRGGYTRILGYGKFSETAVTNTGTVKGVIAVGPSKVLAVRGDGVFYSEGTTWTSKLTISNPAYSRIHYDSYDYGSGEFYVMVDGVNYPSFYNVTANTMAYGVGFPADVLGASFVRNFKNHLFYSVGKTLVFSAPFTDNDFAPANGAGIISVGYDITGLIAFREQLFIFCLDKIFRLSGNALGDFVVQPVTTNTGCISGHTIQEVGGDILYLSNDGIRYLSASERDNDFGLSRASEKIQREVTDWTSTSGSFSSLTITPKNQYRIFLYEDVASEANSEGLIGTKFSDQTAENIAWSTTRGMKVYAASRYSFGEEDEYYFCNDTGYVYRMESGNSFDGTIIDAVFETPYMPISDPKIRKTLYKHSLYTRGGSAVQLYLRVLYDYNAMGVINPDPIVLSEGGAEEVYDGGGTAYDTSVFGVDADVQLYNNVVGSGFVAALRYTNTAIGPTFNLNFAVLEYKNNERR